MSTKNNDASNKVIDFRHCTYNEDYDYSDIIVKDCMIFILEGSMTVSYKDTEFILSKNQMIFFSRNNLFKVHCNKGCNILVVVFERVSAKLRKYAFYKEILNRTNFQIQTKPFGIKGNLRNFLLLISSYLDDGVNTSHFYELSFKMLLWNLRYYYSIEDRMIFLSPIIGEQQSFRDIVMENYNECKNIEELANKCNMSLSSFKSHFRIEFGEAPSKWIKRQTIEDIKYQILFTENSFSEIAFSMNFSSPSHFSIFCKKHLGYTPKEFRNKAKNRK